MKMVTAMSMVGFVLGLASASYGMMGIEQVSRERAKELGVSVVASGAGPELVRVELAAPGALKDFRRVDLYVSEGVCEESCV